MKCSNTHDLTYSVITACLNSGRTIVRCVESVLAQTVLPKEYIFVDGGSTDNTVSLIDRTSGGNSAAQKAISWSLLEQGTPRGISAAWNMALRRCTGDVIFILNSDDWYEPECASRVLSAMRDKSAPDIVQANIRVYERGESEPCGIRYNRPDWLFPVLMPLLHPACFVRREVYETVGNFNTSYVIAGDYDFLWRCKSAGMRFFTLPDVLSNFELGGLANSHRKVARLEMYKVARQHRRILPAIAFTLRYITGR